MEKQVYKTLIKERFNRKNDSGEYFEGFISGIQYAICGYPNGEVYMARKIEGLGLILTTKCDKNAYNEFIEVVKHYYSEKCIFNYEERRSTY